MIIRRRIFKPTNVAPPFDAFDDFSTDRTEAWGGTVPSGGTVDLGQKWAKFQYDTGSNFNFTVDTVNINRGIFAGGAYGASPVIIELLDAPNGSVIGTHAVGIMVELSGAGIIYAWSNSESTQVSTGADIDVNSNFTFICSWNATTNIFSADVQPSTGGTYSVSTTAFAPVGNAWIQIRIDNTPQFANAELDTFTPNSGTYFL